MPNKASFGRFFEDFRVGMTIRHAVPRTVTQGDVSLYLALYPDRHTLYSSDEVAKKCGLGRAPLNEIAAFHIVFGKSVPDISLNAVANLGYANCRFLEPVYPGDTLCSESTVIGVKENSNRKSGIVWVRTIGLDAVDQTLLEFTRWVMVAKRSIDSPAPPTVIPDLPKSIAAEDLTFPKQLNYSSYPFDASGETYRLADYTPGEVIDHGDSVTLEEAEHMMATRLWQNTARVHFDATQRADGRRLIYGGHIISMARALSCNGLANAQPVIAINAGSHVNPSFAGDTISVCTTVVDKCDSPTPGAGAIRLRMIAAKARGESETKNDVLLDLDYWALMPH